MEFLFKWSGQEIDPSAKKSAENDMAGEMAKHYEDILSAPITVHLFADTLTSAISGIAVNSDGKQAIRITRLNSQDNVTTYEPIHG